MKKKQKGSMTVEASIILPFYILTMVFVLNFMNIFYMQLAIQEGLNSTATVLAKYCNVAAVTVGMDSFTLSEKNASNVQSLKTDINTFATNMGEVTNTMKNGFKLSNLEALTKAGKKMFDSAKSMAKTVKDTGGGDVTNLILSGAVELAGGAGVTAIMDNYLQEMKVNQNFLDGNPGEKVKFYLALSQKDNDLILTAEYRYKSPMFSVFFDSIPMKQSVVVHPWVGYKTKGLF